MLAGWVFLSEGMQKFLFPDARTFRKDWNSAAQVMVPFVGVVEIVCGTLVLIGLVGRLAAIPVLFDNPCWLVLYEDRLACKKWNPGHASLSPDRSEDAAWFSPSLLVGGGSLTLDSESVARNFRSPSLGVSRRFLPTAPAEYTKRACPSSVHFAKASLVSTPGITCSFRVSLLSRLRSFMCRERWPKKIFSIFPPMAAILAIMQRRWSNHSLRENS